jgi:hypothetical protein
MMLIGSFSICTVFRLLGTWPEDSAFKLDRTGVLDWGHLPPRGAAFTTANEHTLPEQVTLGRDPQPGTDSRAKLDQKQDGKNAYSELRKNVVSDMESGRTDFVGDWVSKDLAIRHRTTYIQILNFGKQ